MPGRLLASAWWLPGASRVCGSILPSLFAPCRRPDVEQSCIGHLLASRFRDTNSSHGVQFMKGLQVQDIFCEWDNWVNIDIFLKPRSNN